MLYVVNKYPKEVSDYCANRLKASLDLKNSQMSEENNNITVYNINRSLRAVICQKAMFYQSMTHRKIVLYYFFHYTMCISISIVHKTQPAVGVFYITV